MGVQGLRKFIAALSCTKTIYPRQKRSSSAPASLRGEDQKKAPLTADERMQQKVAEQVAGIFSRQQYGGNNDATTTATTSNEKKKGGKNNSAAPTPLDGSITNTSDRLPAAHHVLFDLNSLIHSCFNRLEGAQSTPQNLIEAVKVRLEEILTTIITPTKTLSICLDGPAPVAKIRTQRLRRRRVSAVNMAHNRQFSELSITAGASFMVKLEREVAVFLQQKYSDLFVKQSNAGGANGKDKRVSIYVNGSTSAGEGESKISQMLAFHAYNPHTPYNPNDTVVIVGNDIDLTLTAMGAMYYHNTYVLSASSMQAFCVGDIIYRWICPGSGFLQDAHYLPSARADLIFLFSLNGGDHFPGIGEAAADLWRRYKLLRSTNPSRMIVSEDLTTIDMGFLGDILQINEYEGQADPAIGVMLLKASLWSTFTIITGVCPDYRFTVPDTILPSVSNLKAALVANKHNRHACSIRYNANATPLTPLATYTALMPTQEMFPDGVLKAYQTLPLQTKVNVRTLVAFDGHQQRHNNGASYGNESASMIANTTYRLVPVNLTLETIKKQLSNVNDTHAVISGVEGLIKMAEEHNMLTPAEAARNTFTNPVLITAPSMDRMKRIAELQKETGKGRHLPEHIKRKKEDELKELMAQGPTFEVKQIVISAAEEGGKASTPAATGSNVIVQQQQPLNISDNYYSTINEMLFTNIFNYSINATFDDYEALQELKYDKDGLEISREEQMVGEEMNSFEGFLKSKRTVGDATATNNAAAAAKKGATATTAAPSLTTAIANNTIRRVPVVQAVPEHLQAIRDKAVKIQNKDQQQRDFTNMLKGKRDREVADDDDNTGGHKSERKPTAGADGKSAAKKGRAEAAAPKKNRMMDDDDYDEDAMADLDVDDDDDDDNAGLKGSKKGGKKAAAGGKKKGGRSLADLSDDDDDGGYADAFADSDDDGMGNDLDDGFGGGKGKKGGAPKKGGKKVGGKRK